MSKPRKSGKGGHSKVITRSPKRSSSKGSRSLMPDGFHWAPQLLLWASIAIALYSRVKLLAIPMERDEAGFTYIGHWLLNGKRLYVDMVDNKLPGLYVLCGFFSSLFGYNSTGIHLGLLLSNIVSGVCFYFLVRDVYNKSVAATSTAFLVLLLVSPNILGFAAHATQLLLPFALGGFLVFWKGIHSGRYGLFFIAGLLLGFAFIVKQQSIVFGILAALLWWPLRLVWNKRENKRIPFLEWTLLGVGGLLPVIIVVGYFGLTGRMDDLFFWTVKQPSGMSGTFINTSLELARYFIVLVTKHVEAIWIIAGTGIVFVFISGFQKRAVWFGVMLALFGLGSVIIGAAFYQHYFVLALPGIALLAAVTLHWISLKAGKAGNTVSLVIAAMLILLLIGSERQYFFNPDYNVIHQTAYEKNMFPELERVGKELSRRMPKGSRIGIMGSEPGVLVAADRESCTRHLFMYPLLSDPTLSPPMQSEYLKEMMECATDYIVWNPGSGSWAPGYDKLPMFEQLLQWVEQNYSPMGIAEFRENKPGALAWEEELQSFQSQSDYKIYVFRKK